MVYPISTVDITSLLPPFFLSPALASARQSWGPSLSSRCGDSVPATGSWVERSNASGRAALGRP